MRTGPGFHPYVDSPSQSTKDWLNGHFWRMQTSYGYFDSRLQWYRNAWAYVKLYAIPRTDSAMISQHPDWILRNAHGTRLYIKWGCHNGTCPMYAGDINNAGFRNWWVQYAKGVIARGYKGLWMDNVDLHLVVSDGNGNDQMPVDSRTGRTVTEQDWERDMANYLTYIRNAMPNAELVHNSIWFAGTGTPGSDPSVQQEIKAADWINMERGFGDPNMTGDGGRWSLQSELNFIDIVHRLGSYVNVQDYRLDEGEFPVACYFLISSGHDALGNDQITPHNWQSAYDVKLGKPSGPRYMWNGLLRRDFADGMVLVNPPGRPRVTVRPSGNFSDANGRNVSTVSLSGRQGIVLVGRSFQQSSVAVPVRLNSCGLAFGDYGSDQWADGGNCKVSSAAVDLSKESPAAPLPVYQRGRMTADGDHGFTYTIPYLVPGHAYHIHLDFVDPSSNSAGDRQFNVNINGDRVLTNFDIFRAAGGAYKAVSKDFYGIKPDGHNEIKVEFQDGRSGIAIVHGISALP